MKQHPEGYRSRFGRQGFLVVTAACTLVVACASVARGEGDAIPGEELYLSGRTHQEAGRLLEALSDFEKVASISSPLTVYAEFQSGVVLAELRDFDAAKQRFESVLSRKPDSVLALPARMELGRVLLGERSMKEAAAQLEAALSEFPSPIDRAEARLLLSRAIEDTAEKERVRLLLRQVVRSISSKDDMPVLVGVGDLVERHGTIEDKLRLAEAYFRLKDYGSTLGWCNTVLDGLGEDTEKSSLRRRTLLLRGKARCWTNHGFEGPSSLTELVEEYPGTVEASSALAAIGKEMRRQGRISKWFEASQRLISDYGGSAGAPEVLWNVAQYFEHRSRLGEAEGSYDALAVGYPESLLRDRALFRKGMMAYRQGRVQEALDTWQTVLDDPMSSKLVDDVAYWAGRAQMELGRTHSAAQHFSRAVAEQPLSFYAFRARAMLRTLASSSETAVVRTVAVDDGPPALVLPASLPGLWGVAGSEVRLRFKPGDIAERSAVSETLNAECTEHFRLAKLFLSNLLPEADCELYWLRERLGANEKALEYAWLLYEAGAYGDSFAVAESVSWSGRLERGEFTALLYPLAYWTEVTAAATRAQVDPLLALAVMREESRFSPGCVSSAGAVGLMQLMPATAKWAAERLNVDGFAEQQMENPSLNIKLGVWYLGNLRSTLGTNLLHVIPAYNAGPGNLKRWLDQLSTDDVDLYVESIPIGETRDYVKKVLGSYGAYLTLYGDE